MIRLVAVSIYGRNGLDCLGDSVYHGGQMEEFCMDNAGAKKPGGLEEMGFFGFPASRQPMALRRSGFTLKHYE